MSNEVSGATLLGAHGNGFESLSTEMQAVYLAYYHAIKTFSQMDYSNIKGHDVDDHTLAYEAVEMDHPELFWRSEWLKKHNSKTEVKAGELLFTDKERDRIAHEQRQIDAYVDECLAGLPSNASDYQKVKYVFEYLVHHTDYKKGSKHNQDIRSVFINRVSVCNGYSSAIQYILLKLGIPCFKVSGEIKTQGEFKGDMHAWNYVKVENTWCILDVTWGDKNYHSSHGWSKIMPPHVIDEYVDYDYLNLHTDQLAKDRKLEKGFKYPHCSSDKLDYYVNEGLVFDSRDVSKLARICFDLLSQTRSFVRLRVPKGKVKEYKDWCRNSFESILKAYARSGGNANMISEEYLAGSVSAVSFADLEARGLLKVIYTGLERKEMDTFLLFVKDSDSKSIGGVDLTPVSDDEVPHDSSYVLDYYQENHYFLLGGKEVPETLGLASALGLLDRLGYGNNSFTQARKTPPVKTEEGYRPDMKGTLYCDFCSRALTGVEYDALADGRLRCAHCTKQILKTSAQFQQAFSETKRQHRDFFRIMFKTSVDVSMINARRMAQLLGVQEGGRALGVAIDTAEGKTILLENGCPRVAAVSTIAHELTHVWQYDNWDRSQILRHYGPNARLVVYEGMAVWAQIQYLKLINEVDFAERLLIKSLLRDDEYGEGLRLYYKKYGFSEGAFITKPTPFTAGNRPLG